MEDHDALIRLVSKVEALTQTIAANNIASVERDTRIEVGLKVINGTVRAHETDIRELRSRPYSGVDQETAKEKIERVDEVWTAYRLGRWIVGAVTVALLGQSLALLVLAFNAVQ